MIGATKSRQPRMMVILTGVRVIVAGARREVLLRAGVKAKVGRRRRDRLAVAAGLAARASAVPDLADLVQMAVSAAVLVSARPLAAVVSVPGVLVSQVRPHRTARRR